MATGFNGGFWGEDFSPPLTHDLLTCRGITFLFFFSKIEWLILFEEITPHPLFSYFDFIKHYNI